MKYNFWLFMGRFLLTLTLTSLWACTEGIPEGQNQIEEIARIKGQDVGIPPKNLSETPAGVGRWNPPCGELRCTEGLHMKMGSEDIAQAERLPAQSYGKGDRQPKG